MACHGKALRLITYLHEDSRPRSHAALLKDQRSGPCGDRTEEFYLDRAWSAPFVDKPFDGAKRDFQPAPLTSAR